MTSAPAIVLFCSVFEYVHLGALEVLKDICLHNNILQERSATGELPIGFVANNSPQLYLAAWRSLQAAAIKKFHHCRQMPQTEHQVRTRSRQIRKHRWSMLTTKRFTVYHRPSSTKI